MIQWNELQKKEISKVDLRENYIVTQGVVIQALGYVGAYFLRNPDVDIQGIVSRLKNIDWKRSAACWKFRVIRADGKILTSNRAITLAANQIKQQLGIPLAQDEQIKEEQFLANYNV